VLTVIIAGLADDGVWLIVSCVPDAHRIRFPSQACSPC
jgi:hypothetical protein